jgi:hypothetical protein
MEPLFYSKMWTLLGPIIVRVFPDHMTIKNFWLEGQKSIPISQIASVEVANMGNRSVVVRTTSGKKYRAIIRLRDKKKLGEVLTGLISTK